MKSTIVISVSLGLLVGSLITNYKAKSSLREANRLYNKSIELLDKKKLKLDNELKVLIIERNRIKELRGSNKEQLDTINKYYDERINHVNDMSYDSLLRIVTSHKFSK